MDWQILLYIAAIVAAIGFLILCVALAMTLNSLKNTLKEVTGTVAGLENQLQGVTLETTNLLHKTNELAEDIQVKSEKLNTVVDAVKGVGNSVTDLNSSIRRVTSEVSTQVELNQDKIAQVVQWSNVVMGIRDKWKERKIYESRAASSYAPVPGQKQLPHNDQY
ncbi:hypothetical protein BN1080_02243 [Planococcus massiliensis]|uniref:General stress protein n=1 Tax=Planococcus massiliensis TaxID=1499687 RepID=A0A098ENC9_9BACL|nr:MULTISPECIES: DUF948 domain-containing protein [Planococcus]MCJ1908537.1 DUF948 domain-containing protein [Planococcus ruber]CEG23292.1 hypothetical protein BN1080_02243 [Planococcus massiliensis]